MSDEQVWHRVNGQTNKCACGCGSQTKWNGWSKGYSKFCIGHNGSIYSGAYSEEKASEISEKRKTALCGKTGWSKGLTKETDARVARRAELTSAAVKNDFESGKRSAWSKGLTKESDERVMSFASSIKDRFASGELRPWSVGLTKETDERVAKLANTLSIVHNKKSIREKLDALKRLSEEEIRLRIESDGSSLEVMDGIQNYISDASKVIVVKCKKCGETSQGSLRMFQHGRCFSCSPGGSHGQESIAKFIESLGLSVVRNTRSVLLNGLELDVYVPERNIAVEYNGLYWHSQMRKSSKYHSNKSQAGRDVGVNIIHVFEDEWRDKQKIVESIITSKLCLTQKKIGARQCSVVELGTEQRRDFFDRNHVDGDVAATKSWGLIDASGDVVYCVSVRKPFHKTNGTIEIARCCSKLGYNVQGGMSKSLNEAVDWSKKNGFDRVVTYVDTRLGGNGAGYESAGFKFVTKTVPRFWWTDNVNRFNRFKFKADKDTCMSEFQVAQEAGVVKIWGCENLVFEKLI